MSLIFIPCGTEFAGPSWDDVCTHRMGHDGEHRWRPISSLIVEQPGLFAEAVDALDERRLP